MVTTMEDMAIVMEEDMVMQQFNFNVYFFESVFQFEI